MAVTLMGCSIDALQHQWAEELHGYNHDWDTAWVTLDQILTQLFTLSHVVYFSKDVTKSVSTCYLTSSADELKLIM